MLVIGTDDYAFESEDIKAGRLQIPCKELILVEPNLLSTIDHSRHPLMKKAPTEVVILRNRK